MALLSILRTLLAAISLVILGTAIYLLWLWEQGELVRDANGMLRRDREDWQLWTGAALFIWSVLGRLIIVPLLARSDSDPMALQRGDGRMLDSSSGARLYVEEHGAPDAQPLILTHGWSLVSRAWFYTKRDLAKQFRVIVWDLPGLGRSRRSGGKIDMGALAQDLAAVIATVGGRPAILVGHSIGGMIIQTLARDRPELFGREVAGAVLCNTTFTNPLKTMILSRLALFLRWPVLEPMMRLKILLFPLAWLSSWQSYFSGSLHLATRLGFGRSVTRSQLDRTALLLALNSPAVSAHGDLAMFRWDSHMALARTGVPILVLAGEWDIVTLPAAARTMAAAIPFAGLEEIEGVNHLGPIERAEHYHALIADFAHTAGRTQDRI